MYTEASRKEDLAYFQTHNNCRLPFCIEVASNRVGAHVVVVGATHGNEPAGVKAMVAFHQQVQNGDLKLESGNVSLVLGNPQAFEKDQRYVDRDLNRSFKEPDSTAIEGRRACNIIQYLERNRGIAALLDLHSVSIGDFKICVYEKGNRQSLELTLGISDIPLHFAYHPAHMPGALITAADRLKIGSLIVECGNHRSKQGMNTALKHMQALLAHYRMLPASVEAPQRRGLTVDQYESISAIKPGPNFRFLIADVATGTKLSKGQVFAKDDHQEHTAPQDCYIVVPSRVVKATDVDAGFLGSLNMLKINN
ncbi:MAG: succinylglutamate desuccinylase/aspartoacylase family protein [Deltaproteobacteria bacterium]|jgi:succinylglutamate desuccinylase|nr:succinylglutamate desuccinylase/aspartoacylase family protein [Deltaproteobacteria bacterium]